MSRIPTKGRAALFFSIVLLLGGTAVGGFAQAAPPPPVSGTIVSISGANVTLELADKTQKAVVLQAKTLVLERDVTTLDQIKAGEAMGVTSHRSGADMVASNINIFANEMTGGVRMDEFLMASGDTMTNGTVSGYMQGMNGHTLTMTYPKGKSTIVVPDGIAIYRLVIVKRAALTAGMQIVVRGKADADGKLKAASVSFDGPAKG
jgi:multidrug efflux pump subunit AcrA (membrane-fusion protein)